MIGPTARQQAVLRFIAGHIEAKGYSPSYRQIAPVVGVKSIHQVHRDIARLTDIGEIERLPRLERAFRPTRPVSIPRAPDGAPLYFVAVRL